MNEAVLRVELGDRAYPIHIGPGLAGREAQDARPAAPDHDGWVWPLDRRGQPGLAHRRICPIAVTAKWGI